MRSTWHERPAQQVVPGFYEACARSAFRRMRSRSVRMYKESEGNGGLRASPPKPMKGTAMTTGTHLRQLRGAGPRLCAAGTLTATLAAATLAVTTLGIVANAEAAAPAPRLEQPPTAVHLSASPDAVGSSVALAGYQDTPNGGLAGASVTFTVPTYTCSAAEENDGAFEATASTPIRSRRWPWLVPNAPRVDRRTSTSSKWARQSSSNPERRQATSSSPRCSKPAIQPSP